VQGWTATANAAQGTATAAAGDAIGTATARAGDAMATTTAAVQGTQAAALLAVELAASNRQATLDAASVQAAQTAVAAQAVEAEQAAERTKITNDFAAWWRLAAWPLLIAAVGVLGAWAYRLYTNNQVIQRGPDGSAPLVRQNGKIVVADRSLGPVIDAEKGQDVDPKLLAAISANEQRVQAVRALAAGQQRMPGKQLAQAISPAAVTPGRDGDGEVVEGEVRVVDASDPSVRSLLDEADRHLLEVTND